MKKIFLLLFSILISINSYADYNSGFEAYEKGEYKKALREWKPLAEGGNVDAQAMLGVMYWDGHGVLANEVISAKWFTLAAKQGDSVSQNYIGVAYEQGLGVEKNYKTALKWYRLSAEKKNRYTDDQIQIDSIFYLGNMYKNGYGVPINIIFAHMWFNIAASLGDKESSQIRDKLEINLDSNEISLAKKLAKKCILLNFKCTTLYEDINVEQVKKDTKDFEEIRSAQIEEEQFKEEEVQRILLILKNQEEKRKSEKAKRIADAKKEDEKIVAEIIEKEKRKILDKKIAEEERKALEEKRIFDASKLK
jgi:TPR repeat protein